MPRIRTVKPEFWQDEKLAPLAPVDRLVFLGLISMADDAGRLVDNVKLIDGFLFPSTEDSSRDSLDTLASMSRVIRYTSASGQQLIQIAGWKDHQKVDKPSKYTLPGPTAEQVATAKDSASLAKASRESRERVARSSRSDLGPTTVDLGAGSKPIAPKNGAGWVHEAVADHQELRPGSEISHAIVGKALKPLAKRHGWDVVRPVWRRFLASPNAQFGPHYFARNYPDYTGNGPPQSEKPTAAAKSIEYTELALGVKLR